jgi:hypothetical protein
MAPVKIDTLLHFFPVRWCMALNARPVPSLSVGAQPGRATCMIAWGWKCLDAASFPARHLICYVAQFLQLLFCAVANSVATCFGIGGV